MKKLEKLILLKDLDYAKQEYITKTDKLDMIISLFLDEEPDTVSNIIDNKVKETEEQVNNEINNDTNEDEIDNEIIEEINKDNDILTLPTDIKMLYRKIVMKTHPDKNKNNIDYKDYYERTVQAKNNNDKAELVYIAYKLEIKELYNIDENHFGSIKRKIKETEIVSNKINSNSFWIWYHTDNLQLKKVMSYQIGKTKR
jgi:hypothetical protein